MRALDSAQCAHHYRCGATSPHGRHNALPALLQWEQITTMQTFTEAVLGTGRATVFFPFDLAGMSQAMFLRVLPLVCIAGVVSHAHAQTNDPLLPPDPKPGECYARIYVPDALETYTETVQVDPQSEVYKTIPAVYEWAEHKLLVKPESEELKIIPARYKTETETVIVKEASTELVPYPPEYEVETEKVLVRPAYVTWKKGRGLIERIDDTTGEIMCRVEVPAEYKVIKKRKMVKPAGVREVEIPAKTETVEKQVLVEGPKTVKTIVPATYRTVRYQKVVTPAKHVREIVPAKMETVTKTRRVGEGRMEWRSVLCETNTGGEVMLDIQRALRKAGYNPGNIDGVVGRETMDALAKFQQAQNLPVGKLTLETLDALGVNRR